MSTDVGDLNLSRAWNTPGWVCANPRGSGGGSTRTYNYVAVGQIQGNSSKDFNPAIFLGRFLHLRIFNGQPISGTVTLVGTTQGGTGDATSVFFS